MTVPKPRQRCRGVAQAMTPEERRTHMLRAIGRRAFEPHDDCGQAEWLRCFAQSVLRYVDNPDLQSPRRSPTGWQGRFGNRSLLVCEYVIGPQRSQFDLLRPEWHAQYGIETTAFAPSCIEGEEVDEPSADDIAHVLRGMIDHPRTHLHVFDDTTCHELRIGTGVAAPFLFLFQLRYQLCLDPDRHRDEFDRLAAIFTPAWFRRRNSVEPAHLFGLR